MKAFLELPGLSRRVNPGAVYSYLRHGISDFGEETFLEGVQQVPVGNYLLLSQDDPGKGQPQRYWELKCDETLERFVPGGGLPPARIVPGQYPAAPPQRRAHRHGPFRRDRFHVDRHVDPGGGRGPGRLSRLQLHRRRADDERGALGGPGQPRGADDGPQGADPGGGALRRFRSLDLHARHALRGTGIYAQYRVFQLAHEAGIKVLLDGQGGDELMGGYYWYFYPRLAALLRRGRFGQAARFLPGPAAAQTSMPAGCSATRC